MSGIERKERPAQFECETSDSTHFLAGHRVEKGRLVVGGGGATVRGGAPQLLVSP